MLIGDKTVFAIECHHDGIAWEHHVLGRMCLWLGALRLGDPTKSNCVLDITDGALADAVHRLDRVTDDPLLEGFAANDVFALLDSELYAGGERSSAEISVATQRLFAFCFLNTGGEPFDGTKSYFLGIGDRVQIVFRSQDDEVHDVAVPRATFVDVIERFHTWIENEAQATAESR